MAWDHMRVGEVFSPFFCFLQPCVGLFSIPPVYVRLFSLFNIFGCLSIKKNIKVEQCHLVNPY